MPPDRLIFNGVDGTTGRYRRAPLRLGGVDRSVPRAVVAEPAVKAPMSGVDDRRLAEAGWGVIFPQGREDALREALGQLLRRRREQAGALAACRYRELVWRPGDDKSSFLERHGVGPGSVDPDRLPYYLLIAGGPAEIPWDAQYGLDVGYAVGRLAFDGFEGFRGYARGVVAAEERPARPAAGVVFFAPKHPADEATRLSAELLVRPLAERLASRERNRAGEGAEQADRGRRVVAAAASCEGASGSAAGSAGGSVRCRIGDEATKAALVGHLGGSDTPDFLFTAGHGVCFDSGEPLQLSSQGALLCQEWPGPRALGAVPREQYVAAADVADGADPGGLVAFHFACFSAGTPGRDTFSFLDGIEPPRPIAPHDFVARLPQRLLGHPGGGALAVIGHVDQAFLSSFLWREAGSQIQTFESALRRILDGDPVGAAMEAFGQRFGELAAELSVRLGPGAGGAFGPGSRDWTRLWLAHHDARSYVLLGDPAVRLPVERRDAGA